MMTDGEMLRLYAERGDETAFAEVVRRHLDLVYSVAVRVAAGDTHLAQDVTQLVFTDLARKAGKLSATVTVAGWLHTSARFAASKAVRGERRWRAREREATLMNENNSTPEPDWEQMRPLLDEGVGQLPEPDRDALVLRYFEGKSHREVGELLGLSENSANKRVERALEKLRAHFTQRGVPVSSALLAAAMGANSVQAAPTDLAADVTRTSLASTSGGILGKTFLAAFLMGTKTKIILAVLFLLAIGAAFTLNWPARGAAADADAASTKRPSMAPNGPRAPAPSARVVAPAFPATVPAVASATQAKVDPNTPKFVAEPQTDLKNAIATGIHFLEAKDLLGTLKTLDSPGLIESMRQSGYGSTIEEMAAEMRRQQPETDSLLAEQLELFRNIQNLTPKFSADGKWAIYTIPSPDGGKDRVVSFYRVNGFWYYGSGTEADWDAPP